MNVLVTGGAGYIGSNIVAELLKKNYQVVILDNFSNTLGRGLIEWSEKNNLHPHYVTGDILNQYVLDKLFEDHNFDAVIHCAAKKSIAESMADPLSYLRTNVTGSYKLIATMLKHGVGKLLFTSSAAVYDESRDSYFVSEQSPATNPESSYGLSKLQTEQFLKRLCDANPELSVGVLRCFNVTGAGGSDLLGPELKCDNTDLISAILNVVQGNKEVVEVHTLDGLLPIRDYVHVSDVARAFEFALKYLNEHKGYHCWNIGSGYSYNVLEVIDNFSQCLGQDIPTNLVESGSGRNLAQCANRELAKQQLDWYPYHHLDRAVIDLLGFSTHTGVEDASLSLQ